VAVLDFERRHRRRSDEAVEGRRRPRPTGPHLIVHRIADDHLDVLRVLGARRDWRKLSEDLE